jgi:hypothetical protein
MSVLTPWVAAKCIIEVVKPVSTLSATVVGPEGVAIAGAKVRVLNSGGQILFETISGKDGQFSLKNVKPKGQMVKIKAVGFIEYSYRLGNSADSIAWETLRLSPNSECNDIKVGSATVSQ